MEHDSSLDTYVSAFMLKRYRLVCLLASAGVYAYVLANAPVRSILRIQLSMLITPPRSFVGTLESLGFKESSILPGEAAAARRALDRTASRYPGNADIQVAYAVLGGVGTPEPYVDRVQPLLPLFPADPFVQAAFMRYACTGHIAVRRPEESWLTGDKPGVAATAGNGILPNRLAAYLNAADTGESVDPDNAFFPWMKCVALFGARRDKEALEALHRAAGKKRFYEYLDREVRAQWRLSGEAFGEATAVTRTATVMAILLPQYSQLRAVSRTATYLAAEKERAGKRVEGLAIRIDLLNLSAMMRLQSTIAIGTQVGAAMEQVAMLRPGGAEPVKSGAYTENDTVARERRERFLTYLHSIQRQREAEWIGAELDAGKAARDIVSEVAPRRFFGGAPVLPLMRSWILGMVLLANTVWLAALWAVGAGFFPIVKGRSGGLSAAEGSMLIGVCGGCFILLMGLLTWQQARSIDALNQYKVALDNLTEGGDLSTSTQLPIGPTGFIAAAISLPALIFAASAFGSLFRRSKLLESFFGRLRSIAPIGFALAAAGYLFVAMRTARLERETSYSLERCVQHEGKRLAEIAGKPWPGPVPH